MMDQLDTPLAELEGLRVSPSHGDLSGSNSKCAVACRLRRNQGIYSEMQLREGGNLEVEVNAGWERLVVVPGMARARR